MAFDLNNLLNDLNLVAGLVGLIQNHKGTGVGSYAELLAQALAALTTAGVISADSPLLKGFLKDAASIANFESGQVAIFGNYTVSEKGVPAKAYLATFLEGGPAAQALGL